ncbi:MULTISPECIES: TetR family transcriptional regulator [Staphylococcus]|nr:TetR family transcriptional regulator [Staphylococcus saprophyticus]SIN58740.1 HTH-type dhaKLM operon transcriptional activator dhaS [Mycobacteroides abscessus subsp. abscessus]AMG32347.1 TetR family transcriptional regulator [Staphylococcus saprophyticus]MBC2920236.1 TetR family transcriptional regulator [Staphylococcus saprophyticus]MBC2957524.1 TetR family transcriptional regulator [Staphylococcus saprophyticus]MBC3008354.1 TetR family transcriptional regulator [Staphylococcus saprophyti
MDLRIVKTRKTINDSFYELFEQKDFDKITVKDITEHAQIGRKTFYLHYIDKYDLLGRIVDKKFEALEEICEAKKELGMQQGVKIWFAFFEENKAFFTKLFSIQYSDKYKKNLRTFMEKEFEKKIPYEEGLNQKLDDYVYLTFISNGMVRLIDLYLSADSPYQETLISEVSKLMQIITDPNIGSEQEDCLILNNL